MIDEDTINASLKLNTLVKADGIVEVINNAVKKGVIAASNRAIATTLPLTIKNAMGKSPSKAINKTAINKLKARIKGDIMGDGKLGSGISTAIVGGDGDAMIDIEGKGYMPFVVQKPVRGRKKKGKTTIRQPRFLVSNANLLLNHIYNNTRKKGSNKPMVRYIKKGATYVWTTLDAIKNVVEMLQKRAGNFLSGWKQLASKVGNKKLNTILAGGEHDNDGSAELTVTNNKVILHAENASVPPYKDNYASMVESHFPRWAMEGVRNELKYAMSKLKGKSIKKGWYGKGNK